MLIGIENLVGSAHADQLTGDALSNTIRGGAGNDRLDGGAGADTLFGGAGDDVYFVDGALDVVFENAGEGIDEVRTVASSYALSASSEIENLTFVGTGGFAGTGNEFANVIIGGAGYDILNGGAGADTLNGGAGNDTATYATSATAVTVNLATGIHTGGDAQGDVLIGIENLEGSAHADQLTGNSAANLLEGGAGNDLLTGGSGADLLDGGLGNDTVAYGGARADYRLTRQADGSVEMVDLRAGSPEGPDVVRNAELVRFADGTFSLSALVDGDPPGPVVLPSVVWGGEFAVNTTTGMLDYAQVTALTNGRFVVTWHGQPTGGSTTEVFAQLFEATGTKVGGEFLVNTVTSSFEVVPSAAALADGRFVVTWAGVNGNYRDIWAQLFNADGAKVGGEFLVNSATQNDQIYPQVTALADGRFVVTWEDASGVGGDTSGTGIKGQLFNAAGTKVGGEFLVNSVPTGNQADPQVTALADGRFAVMWTDASGLGGDPSGAGVKVQLFNADGTRSGGEILANTATADAQNRPSLAALSGGRFVATWTDASVGALSLEVKAQLFNADGTKVGSEFTVNTTAVSHQFDSEVTALADGRFVVTWADYAGGYHDVRAQVFNADGTKLGSELLVNQQMTGSQWLPDVAALSDGRIVFTWSDYSGTAGGPRAVRARIAELTSSFTGTGADDTLTGTAGRDEITGGAGNDTLTGLAGDDALEGGAGSDVLSGGNGNDVFVFASSFGADTITDFHAGAGSEDVIDFSTEVFADFASVLAASSQVGADVVIATAAGDTITLKNMQLTILHFNDFLFV